MRRWFGLITAALSFAYLILVLNPIQMLSLLLLPISPRLTRRINRWCARSIWGMWVLMGERLNGIRVEFRGDPLPWRENALVLPNHQSMADVFLLLSMAWRCGRIGDLKWFVKEPVKYVPGPGWGMWLLDCIFVKRDWMKDRKSIFRLFEKYKKHQIPIFLVSFLEGTRKTDEKHAKALAFAEQRGLHMPQHTMIPRTKGFLATMTGLRDHLDAVYDVTIGYPERVPSLVNCFEHVIPRAEVHIRRYPIEDLPTDEAALSDWVFERFKAKDELLAKFAEDGTFGGPSLYPPAELQDWFRSEARSS